MESEDPFYYLALSKSLQTRLVRKVDYVVEDTIVEFRVRIPGTYFIGSKDLEHPFNLLEVPDQIQGFYCGGKCESKANLMFNLFKEGKFSSPLLSEYLVPNEEYPIDFSSKIMVGECIVTLFINDYHIPHIKIIYKGTETHYSPLEEGENLLGRNKAFLFDGTVSRIHFSITKKGDCYTIKDVGTSKAGSVSGTFLLKNEMSVSTNGCMIVRMCDGLYMYCSLVDNKANAKIVELFPMASKNEGNKIKSPFEQ